LAFKKHPVLITLKKRLIPALFGVSVSQINLLIDTIIASVLVSGSISWLYYSDRLLELPLALIGIALATVSLTKLSQHFANQDANAFTQTLEGAFKIAILLGLPAGFGLFALSEPLIITLFQYDAFSSTDAYQSSLSLMAYSTGLLAFISIKLLAPAFLARGDTKTPVRAGILAMLSNIILNPILAYYLSHQGLALATSISAFLNAGLLYFYLKQQNIYRFSPKLKQIFLKVLLASFIMFIFILNFNPAIENYLNADIGFRLIYLSGLIIPAILIYFLSLTLLGIRIKKL
jgi:putative peptidoglycan lipid II flippase